MNLKIIILFLISTNILQAKQEPQDLGLNETEKFQVLSAGIITSVVPGGMGVGYYLYDRPDIGKKYLITQSVLGLTSLGLALSCPEKKSKVLIDPDCTGNNEKALNISFGTFLTIWIWQIFDVIANGKSYLDNNRLSLNINTHQNELLIIGLNFHY